MKKTQAFLLVAATGLILLAGLWATGLLNLGRETDKESPSPEASRKGSEKAAPLELIVGKWEGTDSKGRPAGLEFTDKGVMKVFPFAMMATYKVVDDETLETEVTFGVAEIRRSKFVVTKEELTIDQKNGQQKYKRVQEFSVAMTKNFTKASQKETTSPNPPAAMLSESYSVSAHQGELTHLAFSRNNRFIASVGSDKVMKVWERGTGELKHAFKSHQSRITGLAFCPDGNQLVSTDADGLRVWDMSTGKNGPFLIKAEEDKYGYAVKGPLLFHPDGKEIIVIAGARDIHFYDFSTGKRKHTLTAVKTDSPSSITSIAVSQDGKFLAIGFDWNHVAVWNSEKQQWIITFPRPMSSAVQCESVSFSRDNKHLAAAAYPLRIWDLATEKGSDIKGEMREGRHAIFLADGKYLACVHSDHCIRLWEVKTGQESFLLKGHKHSITSLAISPDGQTMVSGDGSGIMKMWNLSKITDR